MQYFIMVDQAQSMIHILNCHVLYDFLAHIDYRFVRETLICLLTPGDPFFKLNDNVSNLLTDYLCLTGWDKLVIELMKGPNIALVYTEKQRVSHLPSVVAFLNDLPSKLSEDKLIKPKNVFESLYNTLMLIKSKVFLKHTYTDTAELPNIDRIPAEYLPKTLKRMPSLSRGLSLLDNAMPDSVEEIKIMSPKHNPNSKVKHSRTVFSVKAAPSLKRSETTNTNPFEKVKKAVMKQRWSKMFTRMFTRQDSAGNQLFENKLPKISARLYPEKVETFNIGILEKKRVFREKFEYHLRKEKHLMVLLEMVFSILSKPVLDKKNEQSLLWLRQIPGSLSNLKRTELLTTGFYEELICSFMVRIDYKAINDIETPSIFTSGRLVVLLLENLYTALTQRADLLRRADQAHPAREPRVPGQPREVYQPSAQAHLDTRKKIYTAALEASRRKLREFPPHSGRAARGFRRDGGEAQGRPLDHRLDSSFDGAGAVFLGARALREQHVLQPVPAVLQNLRLELLRDHDEQRDDQDRHAGNAVHFLLRLDRRAQDRPAEHDVQHQTLPRRAHRHPGLPGFGGPQA